MKWNRAILFFALWLALPFSSPAQDLVDVRKFIPGVELDIRYATTNNFMKKQIYPQARCFLRRSTAQKLKEVQEELHKSGLGLKVFDGYRPLAMQRKLWATVPDDRYVANPAKGSKHNRGAAVDLTLVDGKGDELQMPTPYDDFTEKAHANYKNLPPDAIKNRALLRQVMEKHGFAGISTEWWHFDDVDWKNYDLLDASFDELDKRAAKATP
jgi:zinc D-Ala-D-Ala dipeptidase